MKKAPYQVALRQVQFYPMRPIVSHQDGHGLTGLGFLWIPQIKKKTVSGLGIVPHVEIPTTVFQCGQDTAACRHSAAPQLLMPSPSQPLVPSLLERGGHLQPRRVLEK